MVKHIRNLLLGLMLFAACSAATAPALSWHLQQEPITVGDPASLSISLRIAKNTIVLGPETFSSFGQATVLEQNIETFERPDYDSLLYSYAITYFKPGICSIPPLRFELRQGDSTLVLNTDSLYLGVRSVLAQTYKDDSTAQPTLRDIPAPLRAGDSGFARKALIATGIAALLGVVIWLISRSIIRYRNRPIPPLPPYEEAQRALSQLQAQGLLAKGQVREWVFALNALFKRYIERRFEVNAEELTTDEIMTWLRACSLPSDLRRQTEQFFEQSHVIKFARFLPDAAATTQLKSCVEQFLEQTRESAPEKAPSAQTRAKPEAPHAV